jgi:APA family basic amino acid/polyamine antiporter
LPGAHIFGEAGGKVMAIFIALGLVSAVSAMMWIGPRVTMTMGEDLHALSWLARKNRRGIPVRATLVQFAIVNLLMLVTTFQKVVNYVQFSLTLFFGAHRPGCLHPALAPAQSLTALSHLGLSGDAGDFSRRELLDALAFAGGCVHARAIALGARDRRAGARDLLSLTEEAT